MSKITAILLLLFSFAISSCSKKQIPTSSARNAPVATTAEMQQFMIGGVERNLDTGRKKPKQIIKTAEKYIGTPHCMGGTTKKCLDCSGLTYISFAKHKISLPRISQEQARYGRLIFDRNDLKRGDLVFFTKSYNTSDYITHVGIYLGNGMFLHVSSSLGATKTSLSNTTLPRDCIAWFYLTTITPSKIPFPDAGFVAQNSDSFTHSFCRCERR